jgi:hypothetical protein
MVGWLSGQRETDWIDQPVEFHRDDLLWWQSLLRRPILKQKVETDTACTIAPSGLLEVSFLMAGERSPETLGWVDDAV